MSISHVQGAQGPTPSSTGVSSVAATFGSAVTSGDLVCGIVYSGNANITNLTSITDNKSNTYTIAQKIYDSTQNGFMALFYLADITNGPTTVTANLVAGTEYVSIIIDEFSGVSTNSPLDQSNIAVFGSVNNVTTVSSDSSTTTQNGELIYGGFCNDGGGVTGDTFTSGGGFTLLEGQTANTASCTVYQVQSNAGAVAASFNWTPSSSLAGYIAGLMTFKVSGTLAGKLRIGVRSKPRFTPIAFLPSRGSIGMRAKMLRSVGTTSMKARMRLSSRGHGLTLHLLAITARAKVGLRAILSSPHSLVEARGRLTLRSIGVAKSKGATRVKGRAVIAQRGASRVAATAFTKARLLVVAQAVAAMHGVTSISARLATSLRSKAKLKSISALAARCVIEFKARTPLILAKLLSARAVMGHSAALARAKGALFMHALIMLSARGSARSSAATGITGRMRLQSRSTAGLFSATRLKAALRARSIGKAGALYGIALASRVSIQVKSRMSGRYRVTLAAVGYVQSKATALAKAVVSLAGRSSVIAHAQGLSLHARFLQGLLRIAALGKGVFRLFQPATQRYIALVAPTWYIARIPANFMPAANQLPPIAPNQVQTVTCDFGAFLPDGVVLTGTPTFTVLEDIAGIDPNPSGILSGTPYIGTAPLPMGSNVPNVAVLQQTSKGVAGAIYLIEVICPRSDGDSAEGYFRLPCVAPH
jgi:hypothetical protein